MYNAFKSAPTGPLNILKYSLHNSLYIFYLYGISSFDRIFLKFFKITSVELFFNSNHSQFHCSACSLFIFDKVSAIKILDSRAKIASAGEVVLDFASENFEYLSLMIKELEDEAFSGLDVVIKLSL